MSDSMFFRNCEKPTITPVTGTIKGKVPSWLNGTLIRNGPGIQNVGKYTYKHMFDGLAVLHRFHIENGVVTYNSRPLESDTYHKNMAANRIVVGEFGTVGIGDPCDTLFSKFKTIFVSNDKKEWDASTNTDNCDVNITYYGDQLYAMTETQYVCRIDPVNLTTIGDTTNLTHYIAVNMASAHPHVLPDGTNLNLGMNYRHMKGSCYLILQVPPSFGSEETCFEDAKIIAEIPSRWRFYPGYYHSFGMTKDKIVFIEQPYCLRVPRVMLNPLKRESFASTLTWYPEEKTRFHVVSFSNGEIHPVVYETENLFLFHHCNAYEENGHIVVDVAGYDTAEFVNNNMEHDTINKKSMIDVGASARRYVLPLDISQAKTGENLVKLDGTSATATLRNGSESETIVDVKPDILHDSWLEFPRINYKFNGLKYKYIYGVSASNPGEGIAFPEPNMLVKVNTETREKQSWIGENVYVGEPVFVANPNIDNVAEDDGVLLSNLLHADDQSKTTFLILDAKTMTEIASVEFKSEGAVTLTFHGQWANSGDKIHTL